MMEKTDNQKQEAAEFNIEGDVDVFIAQLRGLADNTIQEIEGVVKDYKSQALKFMPSSRKEEPIAIIDVDNDDEPDTMAGKEQKQEKYIIKQAAAKISQKPQSQLVQTQPTAQPKLKPPPQKKAKLKPAFVPPPTMRSTRSVRNPVPNNAQAQTANYDKSEEDPFEGAMKWLNTAIEMTAPDRSIFLLMTHVSTCLTKCTSRSCTILKNYLETLAIHQKNGCGNGGDNKKVCKRCIKTSMVLTAHSRICVEKSCNVLGCMLCKMQYARSVNKCTPAAASRRKVLEIDDDST